MAAGSSRDLVVFDVGGHRSQASSSVNQGFFVLLTTVRQSEGYDTPAIWDVLTKTGFFFST